MTVHRFQKNHLGYFKNKKPVGQRFNSTMVPTLHKMTPLLKVSKPNQHHDKHALSFTKSSWSKKRSFSQGNTISTVNKTMTIFM